MGIIHVTCFFLVLLINFELKSSHFVSGKGYCKPEKTLLNETRTVCYNLNKFPTKIPWSAQIKSLEFKNDKSNRLEKIFKGQLQQANLIVLEDLFLEQCSIQEIENGAFKGGYNLLYLSLEGNQLNGIDLNLFEDLTNLTDLRLNNNPIRAFAGNMEFPQMKLETLSLRECELSYLPITIFTHLGKLWWLDLSNNYFTTIKWEVFTPLTKLTTVNLAKNPWKCDCHLRFLRTHLTQKGVYVDNQSETKCNSSLVNNPHLTSIHLDGKRWLNRDFNIDWLACAPKVSDLLYNTTTKSNESETITFTCEYYGVPEPEVKWLFNGKQIAPLQNSSSNGWVIKLNQVRNTSESNLNVNTSYHLKYKQDLIVIKPLGEGGGQYVCKVFNIAGSYNKTVFVNSFLTPSTVKALVPKKEHPFEFSLWLVAVICTGVAVIISVPIVIVVIYFKRKQRRKDLLVRVLSAGVIREIQNDREIFNTSMKPRSVPVSQTGSDLESGYSESDEDYEVQLGIPMKSIPTNSSKTTTL